MTERIMYTGTVEYLTVTVTSDATLDAQPVEFSFDRVTWWPADWVGIAGTTRKAQLLVGDEVPLPARGNRTVYVRLTDTPEAPVQSAGPLLIL